jgi:ABC-type glycerol-3-phosphate transport system substrate-binding protein
VTRRTRLAGALAALACLGSLSACGGDDDVDTSTDPVEVEVGKAFTWNGFAVDDGWTLEGVERSVNAETVTTPRVKGTITNKVDETRAAIFEMVFSQDGDAIATVNCSAAKMQTDQSMAFECPGLSAVMPKDYDAVVVQEFRRDTSSS